MRREDGILEITFHTNGGTLQWSSPAHTEFEEAFLDIGRDGENGVVIMTGAGKDFSGPGVQPGGHPHVVNRSMTTAGWDRIFWEGRGLLMNLLNIEVPVISAINGPALRHAEIPLLADIVLASEEATFQDSAHFTGGLVPGDGMHIVVPHIMGVNRGRYFLFTGQTLTAQQMQDFGLVSEVLPRENLLPRAWELARQLMRQPPLTRRYTKLLVTQDLKRRLHDLLGYGLMTEGAALAAVAHPAPQNRK